MIKSTKRVILTFLTVFSFLAFLPCSVKAAPQIKVSVEGENILVKGNVIKGTEGYGISDSDCEYVTMALFDLTMMTSVTDATVLKLTSQQMEEDRVEFESVLQIINGLNIDMSDPERYVLLGSFEKNEGVVTEQESGSQFSYKVTFENFSISESNESTVQINRTGYIAKDNAELKEGPNDELPAIGEDGLWLKLPKDTEVLVLYKGNYTYKIEYDGKQYYTYHENIRFANNTDEDVIADNIRKTIYEQSMLSEYYAYGISEFGTYTIEGGDITDVIELTREQLMGGVESVEDALKAILKKEKNNGVTSGEIPDAFLDAVIEEDPMQIIGEAANDLYSQGRTEAIREREAELETKNEENREQITENYESEHAQDILKIEINKDVVGALLGKVWDKHMSDDIINAPEDEYGLAISKIYKEILGWDNRLPKNYTKLMECYTGTPQGLSGFDVLNDVDSGNPYTDVKNNISQSEVIREYGDRLSEQLGEYIQEGKLECLPFSYQTKNVSGYNRFLPGSLVIFEVVDFRVLSVSKTQYLGVYVGNGVFYLPDFSETAFDTLCDKLNGIEKVNGLIKITFDNDTKPLNKNASYGFLQLCYRNISVKNVYEADLALLNDPQYNAQDESYFPMTALEMSQIRYDEIAWQLENGWRPPKVWED